MRIGRESILLHFKGWPHKHNQWIPADNTKIEIPIPQNQFVGLPPLDPHEINGMVPEEPASRQPRNHITRPADQKKVLKLAWETGILLEDSFLPLIEALTDMDPKKIRKYRSDNKYRCGKSGT